MWRFALAVWLFIAGLTCLAPQPHAGWQSRDSNYNQNVSGSGASTTLAFRSGPAAVDNTSAATFTSVPLSTAVAGRVVVVGVQARVNSGNTISVTIDSGGGPVAMTKVVDGSTDLLEKNQIWSLVVATGTTATIVVTPSAFATEIQIAVYTITGASSATPFATGNTDFNLINPGTMTITGGVSVPTGGCGIAIFSTDRAITTTWSAGFTVDMHQHDVANGEDIFALSTTTSGTQTPTSTSAPFVTQYAASMATWGP